MVEYGMYPSYRILSSVTLILVGFWAGEVSQPDPPTKLAKDRADLAEKIYDRWAEAFFAGYVSPQGVYRWSLRSVEAKVFADQDEAHKLVAAEAHRIRMQRLQRAIRERVAAGRAGVQAYLIADYDAADAEALLLKAKGADTKAITEAAIARLAAVALIYEAWWRDLDEGGRAAHFSSALSWSRSWLEAEWSLRTKKSERQTAADAYLKRSLELEKLAKQLSDAKKMRAQYLYEATFYRAQAQILVSNENRTANNGESVPLELAKAELNSAKAAYGAWSDDFGQGRSDLELLYQDSVNWRNAAIELARTKAEKVAATEAHLQRMRALQGPVKQWYRAGRVSIRDSLTADYYVVDAELLLANAKK
jgi:hypothetical protein